MEFLKGLLGIAFIIFIAFLLSSDRKSIDWSLVVKGILFQFILAVFILKGDELSSLFAPLGWVKQAFAYLSRFFVIVLDFTTEGARFVFGDLALSPGQEGSLGFFFAFQVLPTIIFFSSLMAILYHLGIMQRVVQAIAWIMLRVLGTSGAESLSVSANIFVGQTEAPLMIRPFLPKLTRSELMAVMTGGMATIAGGVMAAYIQMLGDAFSKAMGVPLDVGRQMFAEHLLGASVMAAPAALVIAKIMLPEREEPLTKGTVKVKVERTARNVIEAAANGASDGLKLALNVGAMLIAFIALISMINYFLSFLNGLSLQKIFGWMFAVPALFIGVPLEDIAKFGSLVGIKLSVNEFVAYLELSRMISEGMLSEKSIIMATYALCGFANLSSIAIQIGGIGPLAPQRISEISSLGPRAMLAGALANLMTATIAGMLI